MLPEILARNLRVVFVGTAITEMSDDLGFYCLGQNDRFWSLLEYAGMTPAAIVPPSERKILLDVKKTGALNEIYKKFFFEKKESGLLKQRIGLTDLNRRRIAKNEDDPAAEPSGEDVQKLVRKMEKYAPWIIAFHTKPELFERCFKPLYPPAHRERGKQDFLIGTSEVWLIGSTKGRAKESDPAEQVFDDLSDHLKSLEKEGTRDSEPS